MVLKSWNKEDLHILDENINLDEVKELDSSEFIALVQSMQDRTYEEDQEE